MVGAARLRRHLHRHGRAGHLLRAGDGGHRAHGARSPRARAEALHRAVAKLPSRSPLVLEVEVSSAIPLLGPRRLYAGPEEVVLPFPTAVFALPARPADKRELLTRRRAARDKRAADRQYDMDHLLTSPFRHGGSALAVAWRGIRRAISREGFAPMRVQGKKYKLDVTGGWAMENGRRWIGL